MVIELSFAEGIKILRPLTVYVFAIAFYGLFVFKFYRFLSRKDIFKLNLKKYNKRAYGGIKKFFDFIYYVVEYVLIFPIFMFFWFLIMSFLLAIMSKTHSGSSIMIISVALVGAVRITAYYHEDLAQDLGKLIPYALLAVFLVDISSFSLSSSFEVVKSMFFLWREMIYYLIFIVILEFILRMSHLFASIFIKIKKN